MKFSKILLVTLVAIASTSINARESSGYKFWHGAGGLLVGAGVIWWAYSSFGEDEAEKTLSEETVQSLNFSQKYIFNASNLEQGEAFYLSFDVVHSSDYSVYPFARYQPFTSKPVFSSFNYNAETTSGMGFKFNLDKQENVRIELSQSQFLSGESENQLTLSYQLNL